MFCGGFLGRCLVNCSRRSRIGLGASWCSTGPIQIKGWVESTVGEQAARAHSRPGRRVVQPYAVLHVHKGSLSRPYVSEPRMMLEVAWPWFIAVNLNCVKAGFMYFLVPPVTSLSIELSERFERVVSHNLCIYSYVVHRETPSNTSITPSEMCCLWWSMWFSSGPRMSTMGSGVTGAHLYTHTVGQVKASPVRPSSSTSFNFCFSVPIRLWTREGVFKRNQNKSNYFYLKYT